MCCKSHPEVWALGDCAVIPAPDGQPYPTPEEAYQWSKGKALYAAGVQFPSVSYGGKIFLPGQANNFSIFPAVGMAIYATRAKRVTDEMFIEAAHALADQVEPGELAQGLLYP